MNSETRGAPYQGLHLSNLLTYLSVSVALGALVLLATGDSPNDPRAFQHGLGFALSLCFVFDLFDGKFAKLFRSRSALLSQMGVQLDSLADTVAFGIFPATVLIQLHDPLAFKLLLPPEQDIKLLTYLAGLIFVICNMTRLAFYNVSQSSHSGFVGVPTTIAAGLLLNVCLLFEWNPWSSVISLLVLAALMVMPIRIPRPPLWVDLLLGVGVLLTGATHFFAMIAYGK